MGVHLIGGCCGTNPYSIKAIAAKLEDHKQKTPPIISCSRPEAEKRDYRFENSS
jgi:hypothetical protein